MSRVAAIGIDASEWGYIQDLMAEGLMPNLAKLEDGSAKVRLANVVEYRSELPWTQFVTGKEAATNRYWSTVRFDPASYDAFAVGAHHGTPFYALDGNAFVIQFDVPHSIIADGVNGVQITSWGAHSAQYPRASKPKGLLREIDDKFGPHPGLNNDYDGGWFQPRFIDGLADALIEGARRRVEISRWLMERFPEWDLFVTVMSETHSAGHHMWHGADETHPLHDAHTGELSRRRLMDVYQAVDTEVGRLVAALPEDVTVVVFSVHGMQANDNDLPSTILLPEFLHRKVFGRPLVKEWPFRAGPGQSPEPVVLNPGRMWLSYMGERFAEGTGERLRRAVRLNTPPAVLEAKRRLQWKLKRRAPKSGQELRTEFPPETDLDPEEIHRTYRENLEWQIPMWYRKYWPSMRAFVLPTFSDGKVRINLAGRERDGVVPPAEYKAALKEVEEAVRACRNPRTGLSVVRDFIRMRDDDPMDPEGPDSDLVILWTDSVDVFDHPEVGRIGPFPFLRTGEHSSNGYAYIQGPGIEPKDLGERSAFDITPTILALAGHEPPFGLTGSSIFPVARH